MNGKTKDVRKERVPLGAPRLKLAVDGRAGYERRWVNDAGGRIDQAIEGGYQFVPRNGAEFKEGDVINRNESVNDAVCKTVGSDGTKAYLMEIPAGYYAADQKAKSDRLLETEKALKQGADEHGKPGKDGRYIPREGIKIST